MLAAMVDTSRPLPSFAWNERAACALKPVVAGFRSPGPVLAPALRLQAMQEAGQLVVEWRQWCSGLPALYEEAAAVDFAPSSDGLRALEVHWQQWTEVRAGWSGVGRGGGNAPHAVLVAGLWMLDMPSVQSVSCMQTCRCMRPRSQAAVGPAGPLSRTLRLPSAPPAALLARRPAQAPPAQGVCAGGDAGADRGEQRHLHAAGQGVHGQGHRRRGAAGVPSAGCCLWWRKGFMRWSGWS
jgi:hypothetical protein